MSLRVQNHPSCDKSSPGSFLLDLDGTLVRSVDSSLLTSLRPSLTSVADYAQNDQTSSSARYLLHQLVRLLRCFSGSSLTGNAVLPLPLNMGLGVANVEILGSLILFSRSSLLKSTATP